MSRLNFKVVPCPPILKQIPTQFFFYLFLSLNLFHYFGDRFNFVCWLGFSIYMCFRRLSYMPPWMSTFRHRLTAGSMFSVSGFDVTECNQNFMLSDSPLAIRFSDSTTMDEMTEPVNPIPEERFRFCNHSELLGLANTNTNTHLPGKFFSLLFLPLSSL